MSVQYYRITNNVIQTFLVMSLSLYAPLVFAEKQLTTMPLPNTKTLDANKIYENIKEKTKNIEINTPKWVEERNGSTVKNSVDFKLTKIILQNNDLLTESEVKELTNPYLNRTITLNDLNILAKKISDEYYKKGYVLTSTWLPPQKITSGQATFKIIKGIIEDVVLNNQTTIKDSVIYTYLDGAIPKKKAFNQKIARDGLILIKELSGVFDVKTNVKPGKTNGTSIVDVTVQKDQRKFYGSLVANNHNSYYASPIRTGLNLAINNITGYADTLMLYTELGLNNNISGKLDFNIPVGVMGAQTGIFVNASKYTLNKDYKDLQAYGDVVGAGIYASYPLLRSQKVKANVNALLASNRSNDHIDSTDVHNSSTIKSLKISSTNIIKVPTSKTAANLDVTYGDIVFASETKKTLDANGNGVQGKFGKINLNITHQQLLTNKLSLKLQGAGQLTNKNLDGSQKFTLGGSQAVRAYPSGEGGGDIGAVAAINLEYQPLPLLNVGIGYDAGMIKTEYAPSVANAKTNSKSLQGLAIYSTLRYKKFHVNTTLATRLTAKAFSEPDTKTRFWLDLVYEF